MLYLLTFVWFWQWAWSQSMVRLTVSFCCSTAVVHSGPLITATYFDLAHFKNCIQIMEAKDASAWVLCDSHFRHKWESQSKQGDCGGSDKTTSGSDSVVLVSLWVCITPHMHICMPHFLHCLKECQYFSVSICVFFEYIFDVDAYWFGY